MIKIPSRDEVFWPDAEHFIDVNTWAFYGRWKDSDPYMLSSVVSGHGFAAYSAIGYGRWKIK